MMLCHDDCKIYTANIGDSGFLVVRHGKVRNTCGEITFFGQICANYASFTPSSAA